ncbi:MAG: hypothetical protein AAF632_15800 [Bacteroidota bacterium]
MTVERTDNEIIFRVSSDIDVEDLQDIINLLEFKAIAKRSKATQADVNKLAKTVKKGRWEEAKKNLGL